MAYNYDSDGDYNPEFVVDVLNDDIDIYSTSTTSTNMQTDVPLIYNENNTLITKEIMEKIINRYVSKKIKIKNIKPYHTALTHKSYTPHPYEYRDEVLDDVNKGTKIAKQKKYYINMRLEDIKKPKHVLELQSQHYERLEFTGDSGYGFIISDYCYHNFENEDEGFLTKMKSKLVNGKLLSELSIAIGLAPYIIISKKLELAGARSMPCVLEDVFEALVYVIFLEFGFEFTKELVTHIIEEHVDITELLVTNTNYVEELIKYYQSKKWPVPKYIDKKTNNDGSQSPTSELYSVYVTGKDGKYIAIGTAGSKKKARQNAAKQALLKLKVITE